MQEDFLSSLHADYLTKFVKQFGYGFNPIFFRGHPTTDGCNSHYVTGDDLRV